jgi:membrane protease YdiL (CAAX protease family)
MGGPTQPLLEASLLFTAFYLASYLSAGSPGQALRLPGFYLAVVTQSLPRSLLVLYLMARGDGLEAFGIAPPKVRDVPRGLACGLGAAFVVLVPAFLFSTLGVENPIFAGAGSGPRASLALLPLAIVTSLATGYCEELFFRSYLLRRLGQAGLSPTWASLASSLLFGSGHAYQGVVGIVSGSLLGLFFAWRWSESRNIHEIAVGHGLFDAAVFAILLYARYS